jgi:hypothetical protein
MRVLRRCLYSKRVVAAGQLGARESALAMSQERERGMSQEREREMS